MLKVHYVEDRIESVLGLQRDLYEKNTQKNYKGAESITAQQVMDAAPQ